MKKLFTVLLGMSLAVLSFANAGIFQTYIVLEIDNGGDQFYQGPIQSGADGTNPDFASQTFSPTTSLVLKGGQVKTFKNGGGNVNSARLNYRFYKQGTTPGAFTAINLPFASDDGNGDQTWNNTGENIVIAADGTVDGGTYVLEAFWDISADNPGGGTTTSATESATVNTAALPVTLTKFTATPQNDRVAISWETALELNNDYFTVERSADGKTFAAIATVEGAGTTERSLGYTYYDETPLNGTNYYRLRQTDFDGTTVVFETVSVEMRGTTTIAAFPNPVKGELTVQLPVAGDVSIYDVNGRLVDLRYFDAGTQVLDLSTLNAGVYYLRGAQGNVTVVKE